MDTKWKDQLKSFISGGVGGIFLVLVGHPFDLLKVRLQTSRDSPSMLGALRKVLRQDGPLGLYRGVSAPVIGIAPIFAVCFWGYELGLQLYDRVLPAGNTDARSMAAGGFSALPTTIIMAPAERLKVIMQTASSQVEAGFGGALNRAWREGGMMSLYKGSMATLARDVPGSVAYFGMYEACKRALKGNDSVELKPAAILVSGGLAGMANWAVAIPADVVKSRWQSAPPGTYRNTIDVLLRLVREEGPGSLFKGIVPVMLRAFPANAACFFGMESSKRALNTIIP